MAQILQRIRVPLGFAFAILFFWMAQPRLGYFIPGMTLGLVGLLLRLSAAGYLHKHRELAMSGPYRWTRNPLYFGSFLMGLGLTLAASNLILVILFGTLFLLVYLPVMRQEEAELTQAYGTRYDHYRSTVPLFVPRFPPKAGDGIHKFSWDQVKENREYNAVAGFLLISTYLLIRLFLK